jgi:hypothetical protein
MKETKLLSMCEFMNYRNEAPVNPKERICDTKENTMNLIWEYCDFLQTPLELKRFVACKDGKPLEKNLMFPANMEGSERAAIHAKEYEEALKDVWFVRIDAEQAEYFITAQCNTIEKTIGKYHLYLTSSKSKDLGLTIE